MAAALQIFNETGDASHVLNLLADAIRLGNIINKPPPILTYPMTY